MDPARDLYPTTYTEPLPAYEPRSYGDIESNIPASSENIDAIRRISPDRAGETTRAAVGLYLARTNPALAELSETIAVIDSNSSSEATESQVIESLFHSISQTSDDAVALLLLTHSHYAGPNTRDARGKTALAAAVETGNIRMVEMLINMGADVDSWSVQGEYELLKKYHNKEFLRKIRERLEEREVNSEGSPSFYTPEYWILRTPLMIAASKGYLPIVRLLINPPCNADHALCAPDGQTALRLAVDNGHREVVDFLPSLRRGGFRRFKHQHATSFYRIKLMTTCARFLFWALVWHVPKFIVYTIPKEAAKELWKAGKYLVTRAIPQMGRYLINAVVGVTKSTWKGLTVHLPRGIKNTGKFIWETITVHVPRTIKSIAKFIWKLITVHIPQMAKSIWEFIWKTITVYIPHAIKVTAKFIWKIITVYVPSVIKGIAKFIWKIITVHIPQMAKSIWKVAKATAVYLKKFVVGSWNLLVKGVLAIVSLIHSILEAVVTFFRSISLKDIWNGFIQVLHWFFVEVPMAIARCLKIAYVGICNAIVSVFGMFGWIVLGIWHMLVVLVTYYPVKLLQVMFEYSKVVVRGGKEILIWFNPKR